MTPPRSAGRHRRPVSRARRRAPFAAAGLLALTGALTPALRHPEARPAAATVSRPAPPSRHKAAKGARRAPVRASRTRLVLANGPTTLYGRATWYGPGFDGRRTASGERFDPEHAMTAAHRTLPFGTLLQVCRPDGRCVVVRVNDRGPFGRAILDLSHLAARRLGIDRMGIANVTATVLVPRRVRVAA